MDTKAGHAPLNGDTEPRGDLGIGTLAMTDGNFTYVSIDDHGQPQVIQRDEPPIPA